jgi:hypothetical protein
MSLMVPMKIFLLLVFFPECPCEDINIICDSSSPLTVLSGYTMRSSNCTSQQVKREDCQLVLVHVVSGV